MGRLRSLLATVRDDGGVAPSPITAVLRASRNQSANTSLYATPEKRRGHLEVYPPPSQRSEGAIYTLADALVTDFAYNACLLYTSPSPRDS